MNKEEIDIGEIVSLHKEMWDETTKKIDVSLNGNIDIAKTIYAECCAYLRGQVVNIEKNKRMEEKRREEQERFNTVFNKNQGETGTDNKLGTTKTPPTTSEGVDLPQKFNIVDPQKPDHVFFSVENGMAIDQNGSYKGTLEPRTGKTGAYYLLKGIGILTHNKNTWYLKDKRNGKWVTTGTIKNLGI